MSHMKKDGTLVPAVPTKPDHLIHEVVTIIPDVGGAFYVGTYRFTGKEDDIVGIAFDSFPPQVRHLRSYGQY